MPRSTVRHLSECFIKPKYNSADAKPIIHLAPWDLVMLSAQYIQNGLLFAKPPPSSNQQQKDLISDVFYELKQSLCLALVHFYPLAGRLATSEQESPPSYLVFIDCKDSPGAKFIHAAVDLTTSDIVSSVEDVHPVVRSLFDHDGAINHDGHTLPLLSIKVTELIDGIFIGCSMNHSVADGTSFWHFFKVWSEIFRSEGQNFQQISRPPIHQRWFPDGYGPFIKLPFTHTNQFVSRYEAPSLRERIFHFSAESLRKLRAKANSDCKTNKISTLQASSAFVWKCVTRARRLPPAQITNCSLSANNRTRLDPPLSENYFGNSLQSVVGTASAGELLDNGLGWAALLLHQAVAYHTDRAVRDWVSRWVKCPFVYQLGEFFGSDNVFVGGSPRFDMYGNEFGLGKAIAVRRGCTNKFDGKVNLYPGVEGGGSMDLGICLSPDFMAALESDGELMGIVSDASYGQDGDGV